MKLAQELQVMYKEHVPAATSSEKRKKHEDLEKSFHENRLKAKKYQSFKKASRKGAFLD
ncbi:hypothetical protein F4775DRAFT_555226 [Biscogniauxia sp. FL1348]|nr:hypothetical protein F4775DRAFT_555226 [Biscogniauxia sp. FL1348]